MSSPPRLLDQLRQELRVKHYSYRTEQTYSRWVRKFILFHGKRHPADMGKPEIEAFLTHLATERNVRRLRKQVQHYPKRVLPCHPATIT